MTDTFITEGEFFITGRGLVIVVLFEKNGYKGLYNKDLRGLFMGKEIVYKSKNYTITGIEVQGWPDKEVDRAGFLLKEKIMADLEDKSFNVNQINGMIGKLQEKGEVSDGYHTFNELYEFRKMYNAALFNEWGEDEGFQYSAKRLEDGRIEVLSDKPVPYKGKYQVHKSWKHFDGELCFGGGWFIVSAMLPTGLISNHYKAEDWDLFKVPEVEKALFEFDGHTGQDVLQRLKQL